MENQLPILKSYDIDYSFIIKNYLNPEMWQKTWTLFQYKTFIVTLNIAYINCQDEKISFKVKVKDNSESTVYSYDFMNNIDKEAKRDAYISVFVSDNAKTDDYKAQYVENARYTIFSDFYLTYAYATKDEKITSKWEEILSESNNIEQLKQEIREYLDFMETTEYVEEMSGRLEDL